MSGKPSLTRRDKGMTPFGPPDNQAKTSTNAGFSVGTGTRMGGRSLLEILTEYRLMRAARGRKGPVFTYIHTRRISHAFTPCVSSM